MEVVAFMIVMVKINTKGLCKDTIDNITKDWSGSFYLVLRINPMVPGGRLLIAVGYKYNTRKVLPFIVTEDTGITHTGLNYLSK